MIHDYAPLVKKNHVTIYLSNPGDGFDGPTINNPWHVVSDYRVDRSHGRQALTTGLLRQRLERSGLPFSIPKHFNIRKADDLELLHAECRQAGYLEYPLLYKVSYYNDQVDVLFKGIVYNRAVSAGYLKHTRYSVLGLAFIKASDLDKCRLDAIETRYGIAYFADRERVLLYLATHSLNFYGGLGPVSTGPSECRLTLGLAYGLKDDRVVSQAPVVTKAKQGRASLTGMKSFACPAVTTDGRQSGWSSWTTAVDNLADGLKPDHVETGPYVKYYDSNDAAEHLRIIFGRPVWMKVISSSPGPAVEFTVDINPERFLTSPKPAVKRYVIHLSRYRLESLRSLVRNRKAFDKHLPVVFRDQARIAIFYQGKRFQTLDLTP